MCCLLFFPLSCRKKRAPSVGTSLHLSGALIIFHAGSLSVPFKKIATAFEKEHPGIHCMLEAAGSRTCARKISELHRRCDIMASADYSVINELLIPKYADWNIRFATNEMAIVFRDASRRSIELTSENWYRILLDKNISFGRSDPDSDPCGYRAVLTMKLAEIFYGEKNLASRLLKKDTAFIRPKETDLLTLLESGAVDYIFLYKSIAKQHKLRYITLPDKINLKSAKFADFYRRAKIKIAGKQPGTFIVKKGAPMVYGITILKDAPNRNAALKFFQFLLSQGKGMRIIEEYGQPSAVPSESRTYNKIPESLKKFAKPFKLAAEGIQPQLHPPEKK